MHPDLYVELDQHIKCGRLECLAQCCDADFDFLIRILRRIPVADIERFRVMLCGCSLTYTPPPVNTAPPVLPPPARTENCVTAIAGWSRQYEGELNTVQTVLLMIQGLDLGGEFSQLIAGLLFALEQLEDARSASTTVLEASVDTLCASLRTLDDGKQRVFDILPPELSSALSPLRDALSYIDLSRLLSLGCCPPRPALPAVPTSNGGVPSRYRTGDTSGDRSVDVMASMTDAERRRLAAVRAGEAQDAARDRANERVG
jgi:hypothetical protein